jgi:hypothetical protein
MAISKDVYTLRALNMHFVKKLIIITKVVLSFIFDKKDQPLAQPTIPNVCFVFLTLSSFQ